MDITSWTNNSDSMMHLKFQREKGNKSLITISFFLLRYYFILFLSIVSTNIFLSKNEMFWNYSAYLITIIFLLYLFLYHLLLEWDIKYAIKNALLDIFLVPKLYILYRKNRECRVDEDKFFNLFKYGTLFVISIYLIFFLLALYHFLITPSLVDRNIKYNLNMDNISLYIIIHNLNILAHIFIGSLLLYSISFWEIYLSGGIVSSLIISTLMEGTYNFLLPHGILEMTSLVVAGGTGITMFHLANAYFAGNFNNEYEYKKFISFNLPKVIMGIGISILLMLFAWGIEYFLLIASHQAIFSNWYYLLYLVDFLIVSSSIIVLWRVYEYGVISTVRLFYLFFLPFLLWFNVTPGHIYYWATNINRVYTTLLVFFSTFYIIKSLLWITNKLEYKDLKISFKEGEIMLLSAEGKSMFPTIKRNDLVVVYKGNIERYLKPLQIIMIRIPFKYAPMIEGRYVSHRVIRRIGDYIITKGDNEIKEDKEVPIWYVEGVVLGRIRMVGNIFEIKKLSDDENLIGIFESNMKKIKELLKCYKNRMSNAHKRRIYGYIVSVVISSIFTFLLWIL